ncbi:MAG: hypothetical protein ACRDDF_00845 [Aeromonas sp.]
MSKLYAVSYMDFNNNDMTIEFHRADNWHTALALHTKVCNDEEYMGYLAGMPMEDAQYEAFNGDWLFDVKEVPSV